MATERTDGKPNLAMEDQERDVVQGTRGESALSKGEAKDG